MRNNKLFYGIAMMLLASVILFIGYSSSTIFSDSSNNDRGKNLMQDSLTITGINSLSVDGNCDVEIFTSDEERVVFFYNKKYYENQSKINGNELQIDFNSLKSKLFSWHTDKGGINVKIYTKGLKSITQDGVGSIESRTTLHSEELTLLNDGVGSMELQVIVNNLFVNNDGVGSIEISGNAVKAKLENYGTGSIDAKSLINKYADVINDGVGSIEVYASDSMDLKNSGVGSISYAGGGKIVSLVSEGVGSIDKQ